MWNWWRRRESVRRRLDGLQRQIQLLAVTSRLESISSGIEEHNRLVAELRPTTINQTVNDPVDSTVNQTVNQTVQGSTATSTVTKTTTEKPSNSESSDSDARPKASTSER